MEKESLEKQTTSILLVYIKCLIYCELQNLRVFFYLQYQLYLGAYSSLSSLFIRPSEDEDNDKL